MNPLPFALLAALIAGTAVSADPGPAGDPSPRSSQLSYVEERGVDIGESARGCNAIVDIPGYSPRTYLMVVDGEVTTRSPDGETQGIGLEEEEVSMIQVRCWSPELGRFLYYPDGLGKRYSTWPVLVVQSLSAFEEAAAPLVELVKAQEAHLRINERFAVTLEELEPFGFDPQAEVEIRVDEGNWTAVTAGSQLYDRCTVGSSISGEGPEGRLEPSCDWSEDAAVDALARWTSAVEDAATPVR